MGRGRATSAKREKGLKKKAWELATLCGVDVCLVGVAPDGSFFCWPDDISEVGRIAQRYLEAVGGSSKDPEASVSRGANRKRAAAAASGETASSRFPMPRSKRAKGSQRDGAADTHEEQNAQKGKGRTAASMQLEVPISNSISLPPGLSRREITGSGAAVCEEPLRYLMGSWSQESTYGLVPLHAATDMGWPPFPLTLPQPSAATMRPSVLVESVLDCGGHIRESSPPTRLVIAEGPARLQTAVGGGLQFHHGDPCRSFLPQRRSDGYLGGGANASRSLDSHGATRDGGQRWVQSRPL